MQKSGQFVAPVEESLLMSVGLPPFPSKFPERKEFDKRYALFTKDHNELTIPPPFRFRK